jgi:hypothetical protein
MSAISVTPPRRLGIGALNERYHSLALKVFLFIVVAHWAEHLVQAFQIWALDRPRPAARGVLGQWFPWLVTSEWLHYGYAIVMLAGLLLLWPGFVGQARVWWTVALVIQFWHHIEHLLLLIQAQIGTFFFGASVPTSVAQVFFPRVELHLFYNSVVFVPMMVAVYLHMRPNDRDLQAMSCSCVDRERVPAETTT